MRHRAAAGGRRTALRAGLFRRSFRRRAESRTGAKAGVSDGTRANVDAQARHHRPCRATVAVKAQAYTAKATAMVALPASMMIVTNPTLAPPAPHEGRTCSAWAQRREKEYEREIKKPLR